MSNRQRVHTLAVMMVLCVPGVYGVTERAESEQAIGQAAAGRRGRVLKQPISFTPPGEEELDEQWLEPPEKLYPFPRCKVADVGGTLRMTANGELLNSYARRVFGRSTRAGDTVERQLRENGYDSS